MDVTKIVLTYRSDLFRMSFVKFDHGFPGIEPINLEGEEKTLNQQTSRYTIRKMQAVPILQVPNSPPTWERASA